MNNSDKIINWKIENTDLLKILKKSYNREVSFKLAERNLLQNQKHVLLSCKILEKKFFFHGVAYKSKTFKFLDSTYSGFILGEKEKKVYIKYYRDINRSLSNFLKKLGYNILILKQYPLKVLNYDPSIPHQNYFRGLKEINGYIFLKNDYQNYLSYNLKREIKIGLDNLEKFRLVTESDSECKSILFSLLDQKLKQKIDKSYINKIYNNAKDDIYKIMIVLDGSEIVAILICSLYSGMATQTYNYSNNKYKKLFINKGLHSKLINQIFDKDKDTIFIFGDSIDNNNGMTSVTSFKQSFSNKSLISVQIFHPINIYGSIYLLIKKMKKKFYDA